MDQRYCSDDELIEVDWPDGTVNVITLLCPDCSAAMDAHFQAVWEDVQSLEDES